MYQNSPSIKGQWIQSKSEHLTKHSWPSNNNYIHYVLKSKFDYCDSFLAFCASTKPPFDSSSTTRLLWIWRLAQAICSKNSSRFQKEFPSEFLKKKALKLFRNPSKILEEFRCCHLLLWQNSEQGSWRTLNISAISVLYISLLYFIFDIVQHFRSEFCLRIRRQRNYSSIATKIPLTKSKVWP